MNNKLIFLFGIILLLGIVSAGVTFDEDYGTYGGYEITSFFPTWLGGGGTSNYNLLDNTVSVINCMANLEVYNELPHNLIDDINFIGKNGEDLSDYILSLRFEIGTYQDVEYNNYSAPIYSEEQTCEDILLNETNATEQNCYFALIGYETYTEEELVWEEYNGEEVQGYAQLKILVERSPLKPIDWIVTFRGEELTKWAWWDSNWDYKRQINITETSGSTLNNYSILLYIPYDSGMNSDFSDLRFTNDGENTELNYWIENKSDSNYAYVWVKIPTLTASSVTSIYMYYGNSGASSNSNGEDTFLWFDSGEVNKVANYTLSGTGGGGSYLDWDSGNNHYVVTGDSSGYDHIWYVDLGISTGFEYRGSVKMNANTECGSGIGFDFYNGAYHMLRYNSGCGGYTGLSLGYTPSNLVEYKYGTTPNTNWNDYKVTRIGTNITSYLNGVQVGSNSAVVTGNGFGMTTRMNSNNAYFKDMIVRPLASSEPTYTIGDEQQSAGTISIDYVTPPTPENGSNLSTPYIPVQVEINYTNATLDNITYNFYKGGVLNASYFYDNETLFVNHTGCTCANWQFNVTACYTETIGLTSNCVTTETREVIIDILPPSINITSPLTSYDYLVDGQLIDLNFSVVDEADHLDSCWYNYNGIDVGVNCDLISIYSNSSVESAEGTSFLLKDNKTINGYVYNMTGEMYASESQSKSIRLNISYENGTVYSETYSSSSTSPINYTMVNPYLDERVSNVTWELREIATSGNVYMRYRDVYYDDSGFNYIAGINNLTLFANDTFGNVGNLTRNLNVNITEFSVNYSDMIYEGQLNSITYNLSIQNTTISNIRINTSNSIYSVDSNYDNGYYIISSNEYIPSTNLDENLFYLNITTPTKSITTREISQEIIPVYLSICNSTINNSFINFSLFNEKNITTSLNGSGEYLIGLSTPYVTDIVILNGSFSNTNNLSICSNIDLNKTNYTYYAGGLIKYTSTGYSNENYNFIKQPYPKDIDLYLLNLTYDSPFKITYFGDTNLPTANRILELWKEYPQYDTYYLTEAPITSTTGEALFNIDTENAKYIVKVYDLNYTLEKTFVNQIFYCDTSIVSLCEEELSGTIQSGTLYDPNRTLDYSITATNTSLNISYQYLDDSVKTTTASVVKKVGTSEITVYNSSIYSSDGQFNIPLSEVSKLNERYQLDIISDGVLVFSGDFIPTPQTDSTGYILTFILLLTFAGMSMTTGVGVILMTTFAFIISGLFLLINGIQISFTTLGYLSPLILIVGLLVWKLSNTEK